MKLLFSVLLSLGLLACGSGAPKSSTEKSAGSNSGVSTGGTVGSTTGGTTGGTSGGTTGSTSGGTSGGSTGGTSGGTSGGSTTGNIQADWYVKAGASGNGTNTNPFGRIQDALSAAQGGQTVLVRDGTYNESLSTVRSGSANGYIKIVAEHSRQALVSASGKVLTVAHAYIEFQGLVFNGNYGASDLVKVQSGGSFLKLTDIEVKQSGRDCIDLDAPNGVTIDKSLIHHCLWYSGGRVDAHGIVSGAAIQNLKILNTEIHTFSGDGFQADPSRTPPGWNNILIENCKIWLQPLPAATNGFPAGATTGENAVDTKTPTGGISNITIRNVVAYGFKGAIANQGVFNLKENINALVDRVTVYNSEVAFRLRGPASVRVQNAVVYSNLTAIRYEDNITNLRVYSSTIGPNTAIFDAANASPSGLDLKNNIFVGALPSEANSSTNKSGAAGIFVNPAAFDYHLKTQVLSLTNISGISTDRDGKSRTGPSYGAFEF